MVAEGECGAAQASDAEFKVGSCNVIHVLRET